MKSYKSYLGRVTERTLAQQGRRCTPKLLKLRLCSDNLIRDPAGEVYSQKQTRELYAAGLMDTNCPHLILLLKEA